MSRKGCPVHAGCGFQQQPCCLPQRVPEEEAFGARGALQVGAHCRHQERAQLHVVQRSMQDLLRPVAIAMRTILRSTADSLLFLAAGASSGHVHPGNSGDAGPVSETSAYGLALGGEPGLYCNHTAV